MTKDDIIRMAKEAGFDAHDMSADFTCNLLDIERFSNLVAEAEREACAKVCDDWPNGRDDVYSIGVAIRARGNT